MTLTVTVSDFKTQFPRFSPMYLPVYTTGTYFKDDIVFYSVTALFYKCKVATTTNLPTVETDWELYNDSVLNYTQDNDILGFINKRNNDIDTRLQRSVVASKSFDNLCFRLRNNH